jgi:uncharacterized membrane protein YfcA
VRAGSGLGIRLGREQSPRFLKTALAMVLLIVSLVMVQRLP